MRLFSIRAREKFLFGRSAKKIFPSAGTLFLGADRERVFRFAGQKFSQGEGKWRIITSCSLFGGFVGFVCI